MSGEMLTDAVRPLSENAGTTEDPQVQVLVHEIAAYTRSFRLILQYIAEQTGHPPLPYRGGPIPIDCLSALSSVARLQGYLYERINNPSKESQWGIFNLDELLESICGVLSANAAEIDSSIIIDHSGYRPGASFVSGDEEAVSVFLVHVVRQILSRSVKDDVTTIKSTFQEELATSESGARISCTLELTSTAHKLPSSSSDTADVTGSGSPFDTSFLRLMLSELRGILLKCEMTIGPTAEEADVDTYLIQMSFPISQPAEMGFGGTIEHGIHSQPTDLMLTEFVDTLSGKKVYVHARPKSALASQVSANFMAWSMDVQHIATYSEMASTVVDDGPLAAGVNVTHSPNDIVFIDNDVTTLKLQLLKMASDPFLEHGQRPTLPGRAKSTPQVRRASLTLLQPIVVHATTLDRFSQVREVVSGVASALTPLPLVILILPAGPRQLLTALHNAYHRNDYSLTPPSPRTLPQLEQLNIRQHSQASIPETPADVLATPASEYFANNPSKHSSAASGIVMQSPEGRPIGMFFEPPIASDRRPSLTSHISFESRRRRYTQTSDNLSIQRSDRRSEDQTPYTTTTPERTTRQNSLPTSSVEPTAELVPKERVVSAGQRPGRSSPKMKPTPPRPESVKKSAQAASNNRDAIVPPINVLIVEDNPINQNILSMFLRKKKIKHETAKDGLEAVEKWRTGGFHLILMDIQLPVMDGIEATKEIRKLEKNNNIGIFPSTPGSDTTSKILSESSQPPASPLRSSVIIVALTASSLQSDRVVALAAGCNDFLTKPVSLKWLDKKIIEWGCMQALIDFDGWRRWKGSDKNSLSDIRRGFTHGPQQAANSLASRLRIERKSAPRSAATATAVAANEDRKSQEALNNTTAGLTSITEVSESNPVLA